MRHMEGMKDREAKQKRLIALERGEMKTRCIYKPTARRFLGRLA